MPLDSPLTPAIAHADKIIKALAGLNQAEVLLKGTPATPVIHAQGSSPAGAAAAPISAADVETALGSDRFLTIQLLIAAKNQPDPAKRKAALAALA